MPIFKTKFGLSVPFALFTQGLHYNPLWEREGERERKKERERESEERGEENE